MPSFTWRIVGRTKIDLSNRSLTSLLSAMIETWQSHDLLTAGCDILHRHKRIYLSSWPWLPTVTMPDHRVITTFTLVKFLLSFAAFTEVLVSVYTRKMFTWVSKLSYLSKPFKSKHGINSSLLKNFASTSWKSIFKIGNLSIFSRISQK